MIFHPQPGDVTVFELSSTVTITIASGIGRAGITWSGSPTVSGSVLRKEGEIRAPDAGDHPALPGDYESRWL